MLMQDDVNSFIENQVVTLMEILRIQHKNHLISFPTNTSPQNLNFPLQLID